MALTGGLAWLGLRPAEDITAQVGSPAPLFEATSLGGDTVRLSDFEGRPVIVNFWASWCTPCRKEFPLLKEVDDAQVLGVIFDDSPKNARRFMDEQDAGWPALLDPHGRIAAAYRVGKKPGIPVTVFIDAAGKITKIHYGELRADDL